MKYLTLSIQQFLINETYLDEVLNFGIQQFLMNETYLDEVLDFEYTTVSDGGGDGGDRDLLGVPHTCPSRVHRGTCQSAIQ